MRSALPRILALSTFLTLAVGGVAWAHVEVTPEEVPPGDFATLTVSVPVEKDIPTTKVRVEVPDGFTVEAVQPVPGWEHQFERQGGVVTAIVWSGGSLKPEEFQQFLVSAATPEDPGDYTWKAFQTYQDGSVVKWTGPPDAEEPAPVVRVGSSSSSAGAEEEMESGHHEHGSHEMGSASASATQSTSASSSASASALPDSGGTGLTLLGAAASVLAVGAMLSVAVMTRLRRG